MFKYQLRLWSNELLLSYINLHIFLNTKYESRNVWNYGTLISFLFLCFFLSLLQLSFSPTTPGWNHARLLGLLAIILAFSMSMLLLSTAAVFFLVTFNTFAFMAAEVSHCYVLIHLRKYNIKCFKRRINVSISQRNFLSASIIN